MAQRGKAKYLGGNGRKTTGISRRAFRPNLQRIRVQEGERSVVRRVCTQCIRSGKVVKANSSIMGRNWIHIRDGSGAREKKDDDLTVTTQDGAAVGDIVVVKGVVHVDRDFGAGYSYPVVVEDAKVTREPASTRADATLR